MAAKMDLSQILYNPYVGEKESVTFSPEKVYDFQLEKTLDEKVLLKKLEKAVEKGTKASLDLKVGNTDRSFRYDPRSRDHPSAQRRTAGRYDHHQLYRCRRTEFRSIYPERTDSASVR